MKASGLVACLVLMTGAVLSCAPRAADAQGSGARGGYLDVIRPDRRPPLVGARDLADSLFGPMSASVRADGVAEARRASLEALVRRFAPTLVLPDGDAIDRNGRTIQLLPIHPLLVADTLRVDRIAAAPYVLRSSADIAFRSAPPESLVRLVTVANDYLSDPDVLETAYFDFPGEKPRDWWAAYAGLRAGPDSAAWGQPVAFAHPFLDESGGLFIQYWYFYPFNDHVGNHEGDWEHVCVGISEDRTRVRSVHYFFHNRSVVLPEGEHRPEIVDESHPVVYVGGRAYVLLDYPMRIFSGDRNCGSHGCYPFAGEWEGAAGLSTTESVSGAGDDSARVVSHDRFRVILTPEPGRIDFQRRPEVLEEWAWFLLPVRWGFPSAPSLGSSIFADAGNQAPFGPAYNAGWNRTAPGLSYPRYPLRKLSSLHSMLEDLVQPWYYPYAFRTPRFVPDARHDGRTREALQSLGLMPRPGGAERGIGSTILGLSIGIPLEEFDDGFETSTGISLWRNFWVKARFGALELLGGYQKFRSRSPEGGSFYVYPLTANMVVRAPDALLRPYATAGVGAYGWESRFPTSLPDTQGVTSGWSFGGTAAVGIEYYLRPKVALDVSVRYHDCEGPGASAGMDSDRLRFFIVQAAHYLRF